MKKLLLIIAIVFSGMLMQAQELTGTIIKGARVYSKTGYKGSWWTASKKIKNVPILGFSKGFFTVLADKETDKPSFVARTYIKEYVEPEFQSLIQEAQIEEARLKDIKKREKIASENAAKIEREKSLIKRYGEEMGNLIINGRLAIGMNMNHVRKSIGMPKKVNRTVTSYGTNEQWVYDKHNKIQYVYFENNILTSWQETR